MPQFDAYLNGKTDLAATPAGTDMVPIVDVSDTTEDAGGTLKIVSVTDLMGAAPGGGSSIDHVQVNPTAGGTSINTSNVWANLSTHIATVTDITLAGAAGDVIGVQLAGRWGTEAQYGKLDVATIVSGTVTNLLSSGSGTPDGEGVPWWFGDNPSGRYHTVSGFIFYTLQSGDISGGNVTLRPRVLTTAAKTLYVSKGSFVALNFGAA